MAEPNRFTEARKVVFLTALASGQTIKGAAARADISVSTIYDHIHVEPALVEAIKKAQGEAEAKLIDAITKSSHSGTTITTPGGKVTVMPGDWRAAAWLLEHHPETRQKFAAIQKTMLSGDPDAPPVAIEVSAPENAQLAEVVLALLEAGALPALPEPKRVNGIAKEPA